MTVSEKLRLVQGLHSHAEMFGFNWNDDSDWTWHDVACKIADEIDAENDNLREQSIRLLDKTLELASENDKLREVARKTWRLAERLCHAIEGPCQGDESCPLGERDEECVYGLIQFELRELGVEVVE